MKDASCGTTFVPLHVGHLTSPFPRSEIVIVSSNAFLHFHEDGERDMYADVKLHGPEFERMRVTTKAEQRVLVAAVRRALAPK